MRTVFALPLAFCAAHVMAQSMPAAATASAPSVPIQYPSVAAALKDLAAKDGDGTVVSHSDGWTIINEPLAAAQWSFTPAGHYAHPAVVRRIIRRSAGGAVSVDTTSICEAPPAQCSKLLDEFATMNERITQAVKARGRQAPTPPAQ